MTPPSSSDVAQRRATGTIEEPFSAWLAVRPGVADGTIMKPSALFPGALRPVSFRVRRPTLT
jgi:hypothetical protein